MDLALAHSVKLVFKKGAQQSSFVTQKKNKLSIEQRQRGTRIGPELSVGTCIGTDRISGEKIYKSADGPLENEHKVKIVH